MHIFSVSLSTIAKLLALAAVPSLAQCSPTNTTTSPSCSWVPGSESDPYPSECYIKDVFGYFVDGNYTAFFSHIAPDVHWTIMGTHPLAGSYHNRTVFIADTIQRLANTLDATKPSSISLYHVIGAGGAWSVQEMHALGICKNGVVYDNWFSWNSRWNKEGVIVEMRAYFDSALVTKVITENESGTFNYTSDRTALFPGPVGAGCAVPA